MTHPDRARPAVARPVEIAEMVPVSETTPTRTPWILAIAALPLLTSIGNALTPATSFVGQYPEITTPSGATIVLQSTLSLVFIATIVFAYLDSRALKQRGYVRPFGWGWAFLGSLVYVIGRVIVVFRRSGRGLGVLWVFLAALAVSSVVSAIKAAEVAQLVIDRVIG